MNNITRGTDHTGARRVREEFRWRNFNAFAARLIKHRLVHFAPLSIYILWQFRDTCEDPDYAGASPAFMLNTTLDWLDSTSEELFADTQDLGINGRSLGKLYQIPSRGFDRPRWLFWAKRFAELSRDERLFDGPTRRRAAGAAEKIMRHFGEATDSDSRTDGE